MDANDCYSRTYVRAKELAKRIGVSERVVRKWQYENLIPYRQMGRMVLFRVSEVEAAIDERLHRPITVNATPGTTLRLGIQALKEEIKGRKRAKHNGTKAATPVTTTMNNDTIAKTGDTEAPRGTASSQPVPTPESTERERP
jgi:excisionase family DNA binding protein